VRLLAALPAVLACAAPLCAQGTYTLAIREVQGDLIATLHARGARIEELLADVAERTHRKLVGLERLDRSEPLSAELADRPLNQVLFTVAGCAGARLRLNPTSIEVFPDLGGGASEDELEEQESIAYLRALQAHPQHALGAHAELVLGGIQEQHGNLRAAIGHYELVARNHPDADELPESLWRAGTLLERLADWTAAAGSFTALANLPVQHVWASRARLELARCLALSGDARQSLLLLDALENLFPTTQYAEVQSRLFVRALALHGAGRRGEALAALAEADRMGIEPGWETQATELRADALEHFDRPAEAARAWLKLAQLVEGSERERALVHAARLARVAGDPLAVLMIERSAEGTGARASIEPWALEARAALGLDVPTAAARLATAIETAQSWLSTHLPHQAALVLEPEWSARAALTESELVQLGTVYARALDEDKGIDLALNAVRLALRDVHGDVGRRALFVVAGELFERHERWDEAARAYGGEL
jgi:tetratricopeptide (TPR) repeat protein